MTERTVTATKAQIKDLMYKCGLLSTKLELEQYQNFFDELFPELPKVGELLLCWNGDTEEKEWRKFLIFDKDGYACTRDDNGTQYIWDNYRRLTPAERGEG